MDEPTLYCPQCDYNLTGLTENRCPECGLGFDPVELARIISKSPLPISIGRAAFYLAASPVLWTALSVFLVLTHAICIAWMGWIAVFATAVVLSIRVSTRLLSKQWRTANSPKERRMLVISNALLAIAFFLAQAFLANYGATLVVSTYYAHGGRLPFDH